MEKLSCFLLVAIISVAFVLPSCKKDKASIYKGCCDSVPLEASFNPGKIYVPNMFTPNDDGLNDLFVIWADSGIEQIETLKITDDDGNDLYKYFNFSPNNYAYGWDSAVNNGEVRHRGIFNYYIKLQNTDGQVFEVNGTACAFVCDEDNAFDNFENCTFGTQHNGLGAYEQFLPSLENGCE